MVQPFSLRLGRVADGVMVGRLPCWKMGSATSDSPEKAGPITAMIFWSPTACVASAGALAGSPCESNSVSATVQLPLSLLCWSMASLAPLRM
jgi:hypothetical protein